MFKDASSNSKEEVNFLEKTRWEFQIKHFCFNVSLISDPSLLSETSHCTKEVVLKLCLASNVQKLIWASKNVNYLIFGEGLITEWRLFSEWDQKRCLCSFELQPLVPPLSTTAGNKLYFLKEREIRQRWTKYISNGTNRVAVNRIRCKKIFGQT